MATIITVSGISGSGKTTIVENTVKNFPELYHKVVTTTTRQPRDDKEKLDSENPKNIIATNKYCKYNLYPKGRYLNNFLI